MAFLTTIPAAVSDYPNHINHIVVADVILMHSIVGLVPTMDKILLQVKVLLCKSLDLPWDQEFTEKYEVFQEQALFELFKHNNSNEKDLVGRGNHTLTSFEI